MRREGLRTAAQARERLGWELPELDELARAADPARALCRLARWLFAAPHRGAAPALSDAEALDARALRALVVAVEELAVQLGPARRSDLRRGAELVALLEQLAVPGVGGVRPGDGADAVLLAEPLEVRARRFRAVFVCGLQEGEFPAAGQPRAVPLRRAPLRAGRRGRPAAARPRGRAARRALPVLRRAVARHRARVPGLPQLRRGGQPGPALAVHRRCGGAAERRLAGPPPPAPARRRRLGCRSGPPPRASAPVRRPTAARRPAASRPRAGACSAREALGRMRHTEILSAGALEAYADCPVRWLIERELQPEPLTPRARGAGPRQPHARRARTGAAASWTGR